MYLVLNKQERLRWWFRSWSRILNIRCSRPCCLHYECSGLLFTHGRMHIVGKLVRQLEATKASVTKIDLAMLLVVRYGNWRTPAWSHCFVWGSLREAYWSTVGKTYADSSSKQPPRCLLCCCSNSLRDSMSPNTGCCIGTDQEDTDRLIGRSIHCSACLEAKCQEEKKEESTRRITRF